MIAITEQATSPIRNLGLSGDEAQLSAQLYYVLVMLSSGAALDTRRNAGVLHVARYAPHRELQSRLCRA